MCIRVVHLMNLVKLYRLPARTDGIFNHRNELADLMYNTGKPRGCGAAGNRETGEFAIRQCNPDSFV